MALLGSCLSDVLAVISIISALLFYWFTSTHGHWKKRNVPFIQPSFPFGNFSKTYTGASSFVGEFSDFYRQLKPHGFGGVFNVRNPLIVICKPELIKQVLTKDFPSFQDRGIPVDEENDPFSANLFSVGGHRWKTLRGKLSPTFTSGKIKVMFPLIYECVQELKRAIIEESKKGNGAAEMRNLLVRFTTDVIGTCAFGIECNSLKNPNSEFYRMGRKIFKAKSTNSIIFVLLAICPQLVSRFATFKSIFAETTDFFRSVMERTVSYRREYNVQRNDFVDLMIRVMDENKDDFNQDTMSAQALLFFSAGLDNVSSNIGFCLHAMAVDQELQDRVYREIASVLDEFHGEMSYEALGKMALVSRVIDEGLRLYPPSGILMRSTTVEKYRIPDTDSIIPKGTPVMIPVQAMHLDEEIFPNPYKFDPDRFTEEEIAKRHPYSYLPFGEGPRFCIASRFALLEMRLCFAELVRHFSFNVAPQTDVPMQLDVTSFAPTPKNKFWLRATQRDAK